MLMLALDPPAPRHCRLSQDQDQLQEAFQFVFVKLSVIHKAKVNFNRVDQSSQLFKQVNDLWHEMFSASDGCLQYFTGVGGQIQTFNYLNAAGLQLSKTDYTVS